MAPNTSHTKKLLPYPIYTFSIDRDSHVKILKIFFQSNGEKNNFDIMNIFCFTLKDEIFK